MLTPKKRMKKQNEMKARGIKQTSNGAFGKSIRITLIYLMVGCLWIVFSDLIVNVIFRELSSVTLVSIAKGVFYVVATAALIFSLVYPYLKNAIAAQQSAQAANTLLEAANAELTKEKEKLVESESRLMASEALFRSIFDQATVGVYIGHSSRYVKTIFGDSPAVNPMYSFITGRTLDELSSLKWTDITHPDDLKADLDNYAKLTSGLVSGYDMEKRYIRPDGSIVWVHMIMSRLYLENLSDFTHLCIVEDITERKQYEIKLKYLSEHDPLTEIYNRNHFEEVLGRDIREQASVKKALLLMTLNDFGALNVTHGYVYGEGFIKRVARKLAESSAPHRHLFQIASDRFIFYVRNYESKEDLQKLCRTVIEVLDESLTEIRVYGTVGVLELDSTQTSVDDILKLASIAAEYAAANHTERYSFFDRNMEASVNRKELIKSELLKCVKNESDTSLYLMYQPIYHAETSAIYGFEALARFASDSTGQVPPGEFIPIAEEAQLIVPLGKRIIRLACGFLKRLESSGIHDKVIAINISAIQLHRDDFLPDLLDAVAKANVNACNITLEITESVFSDSYQKINEKLGAIREKGIAVSIDDFGTGYSSLAREIELNVNCLKLDKQFIDGLMLPDHDAVIVGDIISMAHKLGHSVIAEGVEQEEQRRYLNSHHCDYIQGYLLSRPLPEEKAFRLLE
jgi:PAS domain S-box-containing protein/diguanylate cyclase (GGDEF)-like protein